LKNILQGNQIILSRESSDVDIYLIRMPNELYAVLIGKEGKLISSRSFIQESNKRAALKKAKKYYQKIKQLVITKNFYQLENLD